MSITKLATKSVRVEDCAEDVVATLEPIGRNQLTRILKPLLAGDAPALDVRTLAYDPEGYAVFTKRGLRLTIEEAEALKRNIEAFLTYTASL